MAYKDLEKERRCKKEWYEKNKEKISAQRRAHYQLTKTKVDPKLIEKRRAYQKEYYKNNREKIIASVRTWLAKNPEYHKNYVENNKERTKENRKKHYAENKEKIIQKTKEWAKKAFEKNPDKIRTERRARKKAYKAKDPQRYNEMARRWNKKAENVIASELRDCNIRQLLCKHPVVKRLLPKDIPQELIEVKRLEIQIRRLLNEKRN